MRVRIRVQVEHTYPHFVGGNAGLRDGSPGVLPTTLPFAGT